jgi:thioredoxin-related protein
MQKIIVLIHDKCPHCETIKEKFGNDDRFKIMDVSKESEARELASRLGIHAVPYFLYVDEYGQVCTLNEDGNVGKCVGQVVGNGKRK